MSVFHPGRVSIRTASTSIEDVTNELFAGTDVVWKKDGGKIILTIEKAKASGAVKSAPAPSPSKTLRVTGLVKDANDGLPLIGVNVVLKNNPNVGTATDINGNYIIEAKNGDIVLYADEGGRVFHLRLFNPLRVSESLF